MRLSARRQLPEQVWASAQTALWRFSPGVRVTKVGLNFFGFRVPFPSRSPRRVRASYSGSGLPPRRRRSVRYFSAQLASNSPDAIALRSVTRLRPARHDILLVCHPNMRMHGDPAFLQLQPNRVMRLYEGRGDDRKPSIWDFADRLEDLKQNTVVQLRERRAVLIDGRAVRRD